MKPLKAWSQRSRTVLVLALSAIGIAIVVGVMATDTGPTDAETARYERVRVECTAAVDNLGLAGRQRIDAINDCMVNR